MRYAVHAEPPVEPTGYSGWKSRIGPPAQCGTAPVDQELSSLRCGRCGCSADYHSYNNSQGRPVLPKTQRTINPCCEAVKHKFHIPEQIFFLSVSAGLRKPRIHS
jgi:hypothetical protein